MTTDRVLFLGNRALYGNYGQHNRMIQHTEGITCKTKCLNLKLKLNCENYGIYMTECKSCNMQYIRQTENIFSVKWSAHRTNWSKFKFEQ